MLRKLIGDSRVTPETTMRPDDVAATIVDAVTGSLRYASGETIFLHRKPV